MIANLQLLRGIAALMIVLVHCQPILSHAGAGKDAFGSMLAGIDVFFVISGFIMVHSTRRNPRTARSFMLDRAIRIMPVYWAFTLLTFALFLLAGMKSWTAGDLLDLARSLLFVPYGEAPPNFAPILYVGWTLNMEMYFYLMFAISIAVGGNSEARRLVILSALLLLPVAAALATSADGLPLGFYGRPIVLEFLAGALLGRWSNAIGGMPKWAAWGLVAGGATFILVDPLRPIAAVEHFRFAGAAVAIVAAALALEGRISAARSRAALALGAASYALYLSHPLVISAFNRLQRGLPALQEPAASVVLAAVAIGAAVIVAQLVHRFFELPATRLLRRATGRRVAASQPDMAPLR